MKFLHFVLVLLVVAIWGINFVVIKIGLREASPFFLVTARFILSSLPVLFLVKRPEAPFKLVALYGLIMFALQFSFVFLALHVGVTAGLSAILLQTHIFFTIFLANFIFKEKINLCHIIGALISFAGIGSIAFHMEGGCTFLGFIFMMISAFFWALGGVIAKSMKKARNMSLIVWASLVAWPPLLLATFLIDGNHVFTMLQTISLPTIGSIAYTTILSTFFGIGVWNWLLQRYPLSTVSPFSLLVPIFAMISSCLILDEPLEPWKLYSALMVVSGVFINSLASYITKRVTAQSAVEQIS